MYRVTKTKNFNSLLNDFENLFEMFNGNSFEENTKRDFFTEVPLPGVSKDELIICVKNNTLIVRVELKEPIGFAKNYHNGEFSYYLSDKHDLNNIDAKMENGLLSIKIPLKKEDGDSVLKVKIK